jgi:hypothetical protein
MSRYDVIWGRIKKEAKVEITVHKDQAFTVEGGVKRVKTAENTARRLAGLVGWSKLVITREKINDHKVKIIFSLLYRTDL